MHCINRLLFDILFISDFVSGGFPGRVWCSGGGGSRCDSVGSGCDSGGVPAFTDTQVDVLFLNETFLTSNVPNSLYEVSGFTVFRRDRKVKSGGGIMGFINNNLTVKRRTDLEHVDIEILWLEVCPFRSKRSLIIGSIYRPPSYEKDQDIALEENIERVDLLNKETIILTDINIDHVSRRDYDKHRLVKGLKSMHFKQLVDSITHPVSGSCLDHIYSNHPQHIRNVICHNIGLADHLPIFALRKYAHENFNCHPGKPASIKYRDMKRLNQEQFVEALRQAPWDTGLLLLGF